MGSSFQEGCARLKLRAGHIRKAGTSLVQNESPKEIMQSKSSSSTTPGVSGQRSPASLMRQPRCFLPLFLSANCESGREKARCSGINMAWTQILSRRLNLGSALRGSPRLAHYLFAFVFLVRLIALARLTSSPFLLPSSGDMHFYD